VVADALGCTTDDTITVTDDVVVTGVIEGAGGSDTIEVTGNASVNGGVFGAGEGQDVSAAADTGDVITINTTGTVLGVWGGDDGDASDGVTGDVITWTAGIISDGIYGGNGSDQAFVTATDYDGTQVLDGGDDVLVADGMIDTLTLQGVTVSAPGANVLNWENVVIDGGSVKFSDQALTTGSEAGTGLSIINGGTLDASGGGLALTGNMSNSGIVTTQDGIVGDVINVSGNYTGTGAFNIDVELGDSSSPTDMMVVAGDTSGTTTINVVNVGGVGAATGTGPTDGIQIVQVGGVSDPNAFVLGGTVTIGAFVYDLAQADGQNWYLQSTENSLQGQIFGYSALQAAMGDDLDTLWQRVGQRERLLNADGSLSAAGTKVKTELNRTRVEGRLGANLSGDDDNWTFYTEAGVAIAITGKEYTSFKGIAGARWNF